MVVQYEQTGTSLVNIQDDVVRLLKMATQAILEGTKALIAHDEALARQVSADDAQLNSIRFTIEERCYVQMSKEDRIDKLRSISGIINIATNLERIGDYAAGIAHLVTQLNRLPDPVLPIPAAIPQMAEVAREMVEGSVDAYLTDNDQLAESIVRRDREIDDLHDEVYHELAGFMSRDPSTIDQATHLLWISQNLERIGDRAMNICERAIYVTTGEMKEFR